MENEKLVIVGKEPCPQVNFDFFANTFSFSGTSYPENCVEFFDPILTKLENHLESLSASDVLFELRLSYFNSGSGRAFSKFFDILERCATTGNTVTINWCCEKDDENMIELAHVFEDDFTSANFQVVLYDAI